jgi:hypothetical protein
MKLKFITSSLIFAVLYLTSCIGTAQNNSPTTNQSGNQIEVIQFHSEHRCMTCSKIEEFTKETVKLYPNIPFKLVNVDDKKNEKLAEQFEAAGTALFLYNPKTGKKKDLTDFAFMNAGDKDKYVKALKKEIDQFLKS